MPKQLTSLEDLQQAESHDRERKARLAQIDEELTLYHPDGPWRFFSDRLAEIEQKELEALVYCPETDVERHRGRLTLVRHLANIPSTLMEERARLQESTDD